MTREFRAIGGKAALFLAASFCFAGGAHASGFSDWLQQPTMTGDWGGARTSLKDAGVTTRGSYVGEYADLMSGGTKTGSNYAEQFAVGFDADMNKLAGWQGATFHLTLNYRNGSSASASRIGNKLAVQEIYGGGENFRLSEMTVDQYLDNKFINVKVGYYPIGNDFASSPMLCSFQNLAFCAHPQSLPNDSGWSDYPTAKWSGRVLLNLRPDLYIEAGAAEVNPTNGFAQNGFKLNIQGSTGAVIPVEIGYTSAIGPNKMPGHYKIGGYYDTSDVKSVDSSAIESGRYGAYLVVDQMVWNFEPGTTRGLTLFGQLTFADAATAPMTDYEAVGFLARGPLAFRPHDYFNFGFVHAGLNHRAIGAEQIKLAEEGLSDGGLAGGENLVEFGYGAQLTPWLVLHPNVQYVGNPGAFSYKHTPDAWVFGVQTQATF